MGIAIDGADFVINTAYPYDPIDVNITEICTEKILHQKTFENVFFRPQLILDCFVQ